MSTNNQIDPFDMSDIGVDTPMTRTQGEFDPYDMGTTSRKSIEIRRKINEYEKRQEQIDKDYKKLVDSNVPFLSWQPKWFFQASQALVDKTLDLLNAVPNVTWQEKVLQGRKQGKSLDQIKKENPKLWSHQRHVNTVQEISRGWNTEYIDEEGNTEDVVGLLENGDFGKAGALAAEQAVSNIFSFLATSVNPLAGGAILATSVYGNELKTGLDRYKGGNEVDYDKIRLNSVWKAGNEFIGELIGGTLFRRVSGLKSSGLATDAVKTYTDNFVKRLTKGFFQGFGSEFLAEGFTNNLNQLSDQAIYGDEKTFKDYFRGFINDGIIGGVLGGPLGGGMRAGNVSTRKQALRFIAPGKWQQEMHDIDNKIQTTEDAIKKSNDRTKEPLQKRLEILKQKKAKIDQSLDVTFENATDNEILEYAKKFDGANKQFDIALDANQAPEDRLAAKLEIERLYDEMAQYTKGFVNARTEKVIGQILKTAEVNRKKGISSWWKKDLDIKYLKNDADVAKAIEESGEQGLTRADGMFMAKKDGKFIVYVNEQVAAATGSTNVLGHELLHYVFAKNFQTDNASMRPLVDAFKEYLNETGRSDLINRIENRMKTEGYLNEDGTVKDGNLEEYFEMFTDLIDDGEVGLDEQKSQGIVKATKDVLVGLGLKSVELNDGKAVFDFLRLYHKNLNRTGILGKLTRRGVLNTRLTSKIEGVEVAKGKAATKASRSSLIETINKLQQGATTKDQFQQKDIFEDVFKAVQPGGAISNYIISLGMSREKTQETIDSVIDRLINFDPAAKRKDGSVLGPDSLGEFIMANVGFAKLDAAKTLAKKAEKTKRTTTTDTKEAKELEDVPTKVVKETTKGPRVLSDFNLDLQDGLVDSEVLAEVESLLEENPPNLKEKLDSVVKKHLVKRLKDQVGKIRKVKGKVEVSAEYESFIRNEFTEIVKNLDIQTIRKLPWFDRTKVGTEDVKGTSKVTGKVTNFRKGIFINKANKPKYLKYYTQGGFTTLRERQSALLSRIVDRKVDAIVDKYIEQNSTNVDAVTLAKLNSLTRSLELAENELKTFDTVKYSMSKKMAGEIRQEFEYIKSKARKKGNIYVGYINPFTGEPQNFTDLGKMWEQTFANYFYKMNIDGLEILSQVATEQGGMADFVFKYFGKEEQHEIKAGLMGVFMGSTLFNSYNHATGEITLANDVHNNLLTPEIKREIKKAHKKRVDQWNTEIKKLNKETKEKNLKRPIYDEINYDIVPGSPQFVPYEIYHNKDLGVKSLVAVESNEKPIENHYTSKGVNSISILNTPLGNVSFSFGGSMLRLARLKMRTLIDFTYRNPGSQKRTIDGYKVKMQVVRIGVQFKALEILNKKSELKDMTNQEVFQNDILQAKASKNINNAQTFDKAIKFARTPKKSKGITILDFDDTLATSESLVRFTRPDGTTGTLTPEQYASNYQDMQDLGITFDFSEFNKVVKGKIAPLFQKALKLQGKFGPQNMFVLTARPPQAQQAIFDFLKANGLNIPLQNITGLGNSTAEAKALWIADKAAQGYNDFYFADDALQNVQAVDNMLEQFDVKRKVQQAKVKFANSINEQFNDILEDVTGIDSVKRFAATKGRKRGASKGKFRFFIPPSHEDFVGLLYNFMGKGRKGDAHRDFFEKALIRPLNRANRELDTARQSIANDYKNLNKAMPDVKKMLTQKTPDGDFTYTDAVRVYLWNKHGHTIPGLSPVDEQSLVDLVKSDPMLQSYADAINVISKQETYVDPTDGWESGDLRMDLDDATGRVGRSQYFEEFNENADIIFSPENMNKIEAGYGKGVREALEDMLYRIKTGRNRPSGSNGLVNRLMNYINGAVGSVMFFNIRSSVLQQMSLVNYINFADNNIFAAAKAFANQKQYWADWAFIFNSDMLKQRRGGIQTDVNGAELAETISKSKYPIRTLIRKLLQLGFLPTQIGDNIAIATGGAMYYRNRINKYLRDGLSQKEAEAKAFTDFQNITQSTQQSARPDMISQQQASPIGRLILAFQNVTSQFNRLGKKAFLDIKNRRITPPNTNQMQSDISNASRIAYYFAIQNVIFYSLQTALFAALFDDEEDNKEFFTNKRERLINGSIDSVLRGSGFIGAAISTLKNMGIKFAEQRGKTYNPDESAVILEMFNLSPPLGIKARKIVNAEKTLNYNKKIIKEMDTFDIDNPLWSAVTSFVEGTTNVPVNRLYNKVQNVRQSLDSQNSAFQRVLMFLGWSQYNLGIENKKIEEVKEKVKSKKKKKKRAKKSFGAI